MVNGGEVESGETGVFTSQEIQHLAIWVTDEKNTAGIRDVHFRILFGLFFPLREMRNSFGSKVS